jgi:hypothetical protein
LGQIFIIPAIFWFLVSLLITMNGTEEKEDIIIHPLTDPLQEVEPEGPKGSSWAMFWVTSAIALIISAIVIYLPSFSPLLELLIHSKCRE